MNKAGYYNDKQNWWQSMVDNYLYGRNWYDHILDMLRDRLHWHRITQRITFKCCLLVYKSVHGLVPAYITSSRVKKSAIQRRSGMHSASRDDLVIPATKTKFGECSFAVGGLSAWNALLESVRAAESINIFKCKLKTHLFGLSYDTWWNCKWLSKHPCFRLDCEYGTI